jgi:hypothetical protein
VDLIYKYMYPIILESIGIRLKVTIYFHKAFISSISNLLCFQSIFFTIPTCPA